MSIFDSILGDMSSLEDVFSGVASETTKGGKANSQNQYLQENRLLNLQNRLSLGVDQLRPNATPGQYQVTKSQPTVSVDPADEQQRWISRLNQYLNIVPAPTKGAK